MRLHRFLVPVVLAGLALATAVAALGAPAAGPQDVIISEVMQNPKAVSDAVGEWVELYNPTAAEVDLTGWSIGDAVATHTIAASPALVIPAGGFLVLAREISPALNGGVNAAYDYGSLSFNNNRDAVILRDAGGQVIDRVDYDQDLGWPDPSGASMMLVSSTLDNNLPGSWVTATAVWTGSAGDFGTPGQANAPGFLPAPGANHIIYLPLVRR